jgi:type II secretory pathway component GspD/PulD (secretin)
MKTKLFLFLIAVAAALALASQAQIIQPETAPFPNTFTSAPAPQSDTTTATAVGADKPGTASPSGAATNTASASTNKAAASTNTTPASLQPTGPVMPYQPAVSTDTASASTNTATAANTPTTNEILETISFEDDPLPDAIRTLAIYAGLNIQFDHKLDPMTDPVTHAPIAPPTVKEKWKNVTAMQAMQALLDKYDWQMKRDPNTPVGIISSKEANTVEPQVYKVILLGYSEPTNIVQEVKEALRDRVAITPDNRTHQVIVRTTEREMPAVEQLIGQLDRATGQILIEAKIIETQKNINSAKGIDWTGTTAAQHISVGNGLTGGTVNNGSLTVSAPGASAAVTAPGGRTAAGGNTVTTTSLSSNNFLTTVLGGTGQAGGVSVNTANGFNPTTAFLNADGVSAVLSFLNSDDDTKSIAFPRTVSLDGRKTELSVVKNIPIFEQTQSAPGAGASQGLATVQPNYDKVVGNTILNEVGIKLTVVPRIAGLSNVLISVQPEISSVDTQIAEDTLNGQVNTSPIFDRRTVTTEASVPSGYTLVLGGLDEDVMAKTYTKVPGLGDLPGLGALFRSNTKNHTRDTILIFVTPTIIQDSDFQPTKTDFLRSKNEPMPTGTDPAWDRGSPYDWTKPDSSVAPAKQP